MKSRSSPLRRLRHNMEPMPLPLVQVAAMIRKRFKLRCTASHLSGAERGEKRVGPRVVAALAKVYGVSRENIRVAMNTTMEGADKWKRPRKTRTMKRRTAKSPKAA